MSSTLNTNPTFICESPFIRDLNSNATKTASKFLHYFVVCFEYQREERSLWHQINQ